MYPPNITVVDEASQDQSVKAAVELGQSHSIHETGFGGCNNRNMP